MSLSVEQIERVLAPARKISANLAHVSSNFRADSNLRTFTLRERMRFEGRSEAYGECAAIMNLALDNLVLALKAALDAEEKKT